jgi:hypothetical protein
MRGEHILSRSFWRRLQGGTRCHQFAPAQGRKMRDLRSCQTGE